MRKAEEEHKRFMYEYEQKLLKEAGVRYDRELQTKFIFMYLKYNQYFLDPTIVSTDNPMFDENGKLTKTYLYHPRDPRNADPNVADFPSDTLLAYRYEKCREDYSKLRETKGISWEYKYEWDEYPEIKYDIYHYPDTIVFRSHSRNSLLSRFPGVSDVGYSFI